MKFPNIATNEEFNEHFQSDIWLDVARQICNRHRIPFAELNRSANGEHIVYLVDNSFVIKIYRPFRSCYEREKKALEFLGSKISFKIPDIIGIGEFADFKYILMTQMDGVAVTRSEWLMWPEREQLAFITKLAVDLKTIHLLNADSFVCDWHDFVQNRVQTFIERQVAHGVNSEIIKSLPAFIDANLKLLPEKQPTVFLHGDVHFGNLRLDKSSGTWQVSGLFDFADSRRGLYEYDFLAIGLLMIQGQGALQREFFKAYGYAENELDETLRKRMMMLTMLYETSDLRRYALRLKPEAVDFSLEELERSIWSFVR